MKKIQVKLPSKLSELARIALVDLIKTERTPGYIIDMGVWHAPRTNETCAVCYGGSLLAQRLRSKKVDRHSNICPQHFDGATESKLWALDYLRKGEVSNAYTRLHPRKKRVGFNLDRAVTLYRLNPEKFKSEMARLSVDLEVAGL